MTQEQIRILTNYMKIQGFSLEQTEPFNYCNIINETISTINILERILIEKKEVKDNDKKELLLSQNTVSIKKKDNTCTPQLLSYYITIAKNRQELYLSSKKEFESIQTLLNQSKFKLKELYSEQKELESFKIDFGKDVRNEHGNICENCGCNDAYDQINPLVMELQGVEEIIIVCDECCALIAEEI